MKNACPPWRHLRLSSDPNPPSAVLLPLTICFFRCSNVAADELDECEPGLSSPPCPVRLLPGT